MQTAAAWLAAAPAVARDTPAMFGVPLDFILFALTLLGVALVGLARRRFTTTKANLMGPLQWLALVVFALTILVGIWIIAGCFGRTGHWIDSGSAARRKTRYCRRNLCAHG